MKRLGWWCGLCVLGLLMLGGMRLRFEADVLQLLPGDIPAVRGLQLHQRHFAAEGDLLLTVAAPTADVAEQAARAVAEALRDATSLVARAVWRPPWLDDPAAMADLVAWLWLNAPPDACQALSERLEPAMLEAHLAEVRERLAVSLSPLELGRASYDPLGLTELPGASAATGTPGVAEDQFASADGCFRLIWVSPVAGSSGFHAAARWLAGVQAVAARGLAEGEWSAGVRLAYTGKPAFLAEAALGMERDLRGSVLGTLAAVGLMFWVAHRRWAPLLWLMVLLQVVLLTTAALGGLLLGTINLVSFGFAAILSGLSVDYAMVLYQEWRDRADGAVTVVRRQTARAIWGSALTTAGAFGLLNFAGLPGLGQLGSLVAVGVLVAAVVMLYGFLPLVARGRGSGAACGVGKALAIQPGADRGDRSTARWLGGGRWATAGVLLLGGWIVVERFPAVDHTTQPLSPSHSAAGDAAQEIQRRFNRGGEPVLALVEGGDEIEVRLRLEGLAARLAEVRDAGRVRQFELPLELWPQPEWQQRNVAGLQGLAARAGELRAALQEAGFTAEATAMMERVCQAWVRMDLSAGPRWPEGVSARWLLDRVAARTPTGWLALGLVYPEGATELAPLERELSGVTFCGWQLLGEALLGRVEGRVGWLTAGLGLALALGLRVTLGRWADVALSFGTLGLGFCLLLAVMGLAGWSWNLMNLTALPLLLGAGVDYAIHVQLALHRHGGDVRRVWRTTGRALWLCAGTTVAAFGSLGMSSNAGLASLGRVCAVGVAGVLVSALYLLPAWHYAVRRHRPPMG